VSSPVVLITGALTGIGRATAVLFAQEGAHIVVSGRRDREGQELAAELQGSEQRPYLSVLTSATTMMYEL
jgi:NAD(P)-dependent dehydrogenase (short-subunit alcohol dehydrogenase family)